MMAGDRQQNITMTDAGALPDTHWISRLTGLLMGCVIDSRSVFITKIPMRVGLFIMLNILCSPSALAVSGCVVSVSIKQQCLRMKKRGFVVRRIEIDFLRPSGLGA